MAMQKKEEPPKKAPLKKERAVKEAPAEEAKKEVCNVYEVSYVAGNVGTNVVIKLKNGTYQKFENAMHALEYA